MHPLVKNTIKFFLFLAVSAFLFWLVYRDQNWDELLTVLKEDVNYFWIWSSLCYGDCQSRQPGPAVAVADLHLWGIGFLSGIVLWG